MLEEGQMKLLVEGQVMLELNRKDNGRKKKKKKRRREKVG